MPAPSKPKPQIKEFIRVFLQNSHIPKHAATLVIKIIISNDATQGNKEPGTLKRRLSQKYRPRANEYGFTKMCGTELQQSNFSSNATYGFSAREKRDIRVSTRLQVRVDGKLRDSTCHVFRTRVASKRGLQLDLLMQLRILRRAVGSRRSRSVL